MMIQKIFSLSAQSSDRLAWMDYAKGIAITMVVLRHNTIGMQLGGVPISESVFEVVDNVGLTYRMPLFFLLSGIFFRKSILKRSETGYVIHKAKTILYPYLVWAFIITTIQLMMSSHVNTDVSGWSYLDIFIAPTGHWWFLMALFNVSVLYLLMHLLSRGHHAIMLLIGLGMYYASPYLADFANVFHIFRLFIFFVLGDLISKTILSKKSQPVLSSSWLMVAFFILSVLGEWILFQESWRNNLTFGLLFALVGSAAIIWISYHLARRNSGYFSVIRTIGQFSLYVYLLHSLVGAAIRIGFVNGLGINNYWLMIPVSVVASVTIPIFVSRASKLFGLWFLFTPDAPAKPASLKTVNS